MDLLPIAHPGWVALQPAEVIGIALRQLGNGEACVVPEVEARRVKARGLGSFETGTYWLTAAWGDLDRFTVVRALFHCVTIVRLAGVRPQRNSCTIMGPMYWPLADASGLGERAA
jgi:hypothetical protein